MEPACHTAGSDLQCRGSKHESGCALLRVECRACLTCFGKIRVVLYCKLGSLVGYFLLNRGSRKEPRSRLLSQCAGQLLSKGSRVVNLGSDSLQAQCSLEDILGTKPARPRCTDPLDPSYKAGSALSGNASTKSDASTQPGGEWLPNRNSNQGSGFSVLFRVGGA